MAEVFRIRRTARRVEALRQVMAEAILYDSNTGEYFETTPDGVARLAGARRRTYATLRVDGLITVDDTDDAQRVPLELTERGVTVAEKWELTSQQKTG